MHCVRGKRKKENRGNRNLPPLLFTCSRTLKKLKKSQQATPHAATSLGSLSVRNVRMAARAQCAYNTYAEL